MKITSILAGLTITFILSTCTLQPVNELLPPSLLPVETESGYPLVIDYSYAGYKLGMEKPSWKNLDLPLVHVDSFGAIPNDGLDDIAAIQAAVDSMGKSGGGIIKFSPGRYDFDVNERHGFVHVPYSNIILLGSGQGPDGTSLFDHRPSETPVPGKLWLAGVYPSFFNISPVSYPDTYSPGDGKMILKASLRKGNKEQNYLVLKDSLIELDTNQVYMLTMSTKDRKLLSDLIAPLEKAGENYERMDNTGVYKVRQLVKISRVEKNRIWFDAPVIWNISDEYRLELWEFPFHFVHNTAVVGFRMVTPFYEEFYHHKNSEHDNGWDHISISYSYNSYAFGLIHENPSTAVGIKNSLNCTVFDAQIRGNTGHNGFICGGYSTRNLLHNLDGGKAFHTFGISGFASGNVFYNCISLESTSIDCHGGLSVYNLFDNIIGPNWAHGGSRKNLPPAHAARLTIWNWKVGLKEPYKGRIKQKLSGFHETPGFFFTGIQGLHDQSIFLKDLDKKKINSDYRGEWGFNINFRESPPVPSLYMFQRDKRIRDEFIIR